MKVRLFLTQFGFSSVLLLCLSAPVIAALQEDDYLTDAEIDQLRTEEGKDPPERLKLLNEFLKIRFERAKAVKTGIPFKVKEAKEKPGKEGASGKKGTPKAGAATGSPPAPVARTFRELLEDYLKCVDEISANVEDFSTLRFTEPKPYLKSLKNLSESLTEQDKWIQTLQNQGEKPEREILVDISEALKDLLDNVKANINEVNVQIEDAKDARKGKSFQ